MDVAPFLCAPEMLSTNPLPQLHSSLGKAATPTSQIEASGSTTVRAFPAP
jgi:hypothetical protein